MINVCCFVFEFVVGGVKVGIGVILLKGFVLVCKVEGVVLCEWCGWDVDKD